MNKKGAKMSGGLVLLIAAIFIFGYTQGFFDNFLSPAVDTPEPGADNCPSSGLTEVTLNAQEALASSATAANVSYYIYENGMLIKNGDTGDDGTVAIDLACGEGKSYEALILNEKTETGFYPQTITIEANGATVTKNLKMYEYGSMNLASVVSSSSPAGNGSISPGTGKNCGFTLTFSENESAAAYNKPLIMCLVNSTAVIDVTMTGVTEVAHKKPIRVTSPGNHQYYVFEYDEMIKSTDGAVKVNGKLQFTSSATVDDNGGSNNMSCILVDQASYRKAEYQTLELSEGFVEAGENSETIVDIGALDSNRQTLYFNGDYC